MYHVHNAGGSEYEAADQTRRAAWPAAENAAAAPPDPQGPGDAERSACGETSAAGPDRSDTHGWRLTAALVEVDPPPAAKPVRSAPSVEEPSRTWRERLAEKVRAGRVNLSRKEAEAVRGLVETVERRRQVGSLNVSRLQLDKVTEAARLGDVIMVEAPGLYFLDYGGRVAYEGLLAEDRRVMEFASAFVKGLREEYPEAKIVVVGLYDDYNFKKPNSLESAVPWPFDPDRVREFRESVLGVLEEAGLILPGARHWQEHIDFFEADLVRVARNLVDDLTREGHTIESNGRVDYVNSEVENPEHFRFPLIDRSGRPYCVILDLAKMLESLKIIRGVHPGRQVRHVAAFGSCFKSQQDQLWELLLIFGVKYHECHTVFIREDSPPGQVTLDTQRLLRSARRPYGQSHDRHELTA